MKNWLTRLLPPLLVVMLPMLGMLAHAQPVPPLGIADDAASSASAPAEPATGASAASGGPRHRHARHPDHDVVNIGHDSQIPPTETVDSVVAIFGDTRVAGTVTSDAVAVFGNTEIDGKTGGDVVAVFGNVELGPHADIGGDVVAVAGAVSRDPAAVVHGDVQSVFGGGGGFHWLRPWIDDCLFYARPLAFDAGVDWAWGLALAALALYACIALLFQEGVAQCVRTLETRPGHVLLAALLTVLITPVLLVVLCVTVIGIAAVPFVALGIFCASVFGKATLLEWLGWRCIGGRAAAGPLRQPALAVLIGGAVVLLLYVVPVLGFVTYNLLGLIGLGAVVYTLLGAARARWPGGVEPPAKAAAGPGVAPTAAPDAAPAAGASFAPETGSGATGATGATGASAAVSGATRAESANALMPRAGFWIRMAALLLDAVLIGFLTHLLRRAGDLELPVLAAYGAIMWKLRGSTVGGLVFDLQVVRLDAREMDWPTAVVRALGCFLSLVVAGLGFIWIAFDPGKQAWHDKIAGTVVVRMPKGVPVAAGTT